MKCSGYLTPGAAQCKGLLPALGKRPDAGHFVAIKKRTTKSYLPRTPRKVFGRERPGRTQDARRPLGGPKGKPKPARVPANPPTLPQVQLSASYPRRPVCEEISWQCGS